MPVFSDAAAQLGDYACEAGRNLSNILQNPKSDISAVTFVGCSNSHILSITSMYIRSLSGWTTNCSTQCSSPKRKTSLISVKSRLLADNLIITHIQSESFSTGCQNVIILSKYTRENCPWLVNRIMSIFLSNVLDPFFKMYNTQRNLYSPQRKGNVILIFSLSSISICQYPDLSSSIEVSQQFLSSPDAPPLVLSIRHPWQ